jgi:hypothetical protein
MHMLGGLCYVPCKVAGFIRTEESKQVVLGAGKLWLVNTSEAM